MARSALLNIMVKAARKAGRALTRDFGEVENLQVSRKGPGDFVSKADHKAEKIIREELQLARPDYGLVLEEAGVIEGADANHRWIVDPLDGTTNFLHGLPHFAVSIALERQKQLVAGVIYNPVTDELYVAEKGRGAFLNDRRLRVSGRRNLVDCLIATGVPHLGRGDHGAYLTVLPKVMQNVAGIRRFGAAALDLAFVAAGRYDGYFESHLHPWDMAAGLVILKEAGGFACDYQGRDNMLETGTVIAGNETVRDGLLNLIQA
jgi:myo-inositol-1(or 4)-monophosphatase